MKYLFKKLDFGITWPKKEASTSADYMRLYYHGLKKTHLTELYKQYAADFEVTNLCEKSIIFTFFKTILVII